MATSFSSPAELEGSIGKHLGYSEWMDVDQERINTFADATGDHQWIHVDPEAAKNGPFGTTIAHGYLTLSLVSMMLPQIVHVSGISMGINYGTEKVRFPAPVPVGSRIRGGAELVEVEIPDLQQRLRGFSLERHEFKWDLMDYLAGNPGSPVTSLAQILDRRLIHEDAIIQARRYEETPSRMTEAYRKALAIGPPLLNSTEGLLNDRNLDALVYPVVQRRPAPLGESQRGSTCALSVVTGLPALAIPVGLTYAGLPVGLELLGRHFDDARLVSLGFAFEEAASPRRSPPTTPPVTER